MKRVISIHVYTVQIEYLKRIFKPINLEVKSGWKGYEHKHFTDLNEFKIKQVERQQAVRICIQDEATPSSYYLPTKDIYHVTPKELGRENRREVQETLGTIMMGIIIIEA